MNQLPLLSINYCCVIKIIFKNSLVHTVKYLTLCTKLLFIKLNNKISYSGFTTLLKLPEIMWSEDYYVTLLQENFKTFDSLIANGIPLLGEMIWNFADFKTPQGKKIEKMISSITAHNFFSEFIRPGLCEKGLFTRERQPKMAAYVVKERYNMFTSNSAKKLFSYNEFWFK